MAEDLDDLGWKELWLPWLYGVLLVNRKKLKPSTVRSVQKQCQPHGLAEAAQQNPQEVAAAAAAVVVAALKVTIHML